MKCNETQIWKVIVGKSLAAWKALSLKIARGCVFEAKAEDYVCYWTIKMVTASLKIMTY